MHPSHVYRRWFGSFLLAAAGAAGCAQSGTSNPVAATSSGSDSASISVSPSSSIAQAGPGASYDASGTYQVDARLKPNGDPFPPDIITLAQDGAGNLHGVIPGGHPTTVDLVRKGSGQTIDYEVNVFEPHTLCNTQLSGQAHLNTKTGVLQGHISGVEQDCSPADYFITLTKL